MNEFGDFANIDVERLLSGARERHAKLQALQERIAELVGQSQDRDGLVRVTFNSGGLDELTIDPRAMRKGSQELAATIRELVREATADLQRQITDVTREALGTDAVGLDRDAALAKAQEAQEAFNRTMTDAVGELDKIRKRLNL